MEKTISLYWWNKRKNFGDAISPALVRYVSGKKVTWAPPHESELIAIGSVLAFSGIAERIVGRLPKPLTVWGSGSLIWPNFLSNSRPEISFACVRGPITASLIPNFNGAIGDPGLLCDRVFKVQKKNLGIGVVPHLSQMSDRAFLDEVKIYDYTIIDVRQENPADVVEQISACSVVLAGSLHGLIVADAFGIPNIWLDGPKFGPSDYKFFDYFASVGRYAVTRQNLKSCAKIIKSESFDTTYMSRLEHIKDGIIDAFKYE